MKDVSAILKYPVIGVQVISQVAPPAQLIVVEGQRRQLHLLSLEKARRQHRREAFIKNAVKSSRLFRMRPTEAAASENDEQTKPAQERRRRASQIQIGRAHV